MSESLVKPHYQCGWNRTEAGEAVLLARATQATIYLRFNLGRDQAAVSVQAKLLVFFKLL